MPRKMISKQQVIDAAQILVNSDRNPTLAAVRRQLNFLGSNSTIHKYLKEWKKSCFGQSKITTTLNLKDQSNTGELIEKQYYLEKKLQQQVDQNENYIQELINAEKANIEFKEEILQLQSRNQKLQLELTEAKATNRALAQLTQGIQNKLDINSNSTIQKMQQTIDDLRLELKTLNETYINALRETSTQGHEALMQEKVNSINLQTKIDNLTKELLDSKKKAYEASMTTQIQNRSLSRQNEQLQKIIEENGLDKLLSAAEGSSLAFTNGAAVDGK